MTAGTLPDVAPPDSAPQARVLVLGYGNPGRQDDGLGPAAVAEIEKMGLADITTEENYQLVLEDALAIAEHDLIWFIDAARIGPEPYEIRKLKASHEVAFTSHLVKPETLLAIVEQHLGKSPEAYLLGIRGYEFEFDEGLTACAKQNLLQAVEEVCQRVSRFRERTR